MSSRSTAVAVFDISSSSVAGAHALVETRKGVNTVTMLVQERRDSALEEELNIERFVENTTKTLEVVINHIRTADLHHPTAIQVILASPWYSTEIRTIVYNKTSDFTITGRFVDSLIEKEIEHVLKRTDKNGQQLRDTLTIVERRLARVLINGYDTTDPFGKKVQSLEITLILTLVPTIVVERFQSSIRRSYGDRPINVTTNTYATYIALRDQVNTPEEYALIDVGEEVTDIAFVRQGHFLHNHSFPVGTYELYRALATLNGSSIEARALVEAYRLGKLSALHTKTVEKALETFATTWQRALQHTIEEGKSGFHIPSQYILVSDPRFENIFKSIIRADTFLNHEAVTKTVHVRCLQSSDFSMTVKSTTVDTIDVSLAAAALFSERLL